MTTILDKARQVAADYFELIGNDAAACLIRTAPNASIPCGLLVRLRDSNLLAREPKKLTDGDLRKIMRNLDCELGNTRMRGTYDYTLAVMQRAAKAAYPNFAAMEKELAEAKQELAELRQQISDAENAKHGASGLCCELRGREERERQETYRIATKLLASVAPRLVPCPDTIGILTQFRNFVDGKNHIIAKLEESLNRAAGNIQSGLPEMFPSLDILDVGVACREVMEELSKRDAKITALEKLTAEKKPEPTPEETIAKARDLVSYDAGAREAIKAICDLAERQAAELKVFRSKLSDFSKEQSERAGVVGVDPAKAGEDKTVTQIVEATPISDFPQWWEHDGHDGESHYYCFHNAKDDGDVYYEDGKPFTMFPWNLRGMYHLGPAKFKRIPGKPEAVRKWAGEHGTEGVQP